MKGFNIMRRTGGVAIMLSIAACCFGQKLTIGPVAGVNYTSLTNFKSATQEKYHYRLGLKAGLNTTFSMWEYWAINGQVTFSQKGVYYETENEGFITEHRIRLNYIDVPILATFFMNDRRSILRPKVFFGPSFGFLLDGRSPGDGFVSSLKNTEIAGVAGAGLNYRVAKRIWLNADLRYFYDAMELSGRPVMKRWNHGATALVGINFGIGKIDNKKSKGYRHHENKDDLDE